MSPRDTIGRDRPPAEGKVRGPRSRAVGRPCRRHPLPHLPGIAERPGTDVTVADVAGEFGLHPNVARMHLAKLEQAGFLITGFRRAAGGGRPAKLYRLSDLVVTFGFPPRRYELLSRLALGRSPQAARATTRCACAARPAPPRGAGACRRRRPPERPGGRRRPGRRDRRGAGAAARGRWMDGSLSVIVNNCSFRELSDADPDLVCAMHRAFLEGVLRSPPPASAAADRPRRLPDQLRRRALRDAVLVLAGDG